MTKYEQTVKQYGPRFMKDLGLTKEQVAGIFGNFYVETGGFTLMQEVKPLVKGSKGGYGWAQWTGPRRRAFEAWAKANSFDKTKDESNYLYVIYELKGPESNALKLLKKATTSEEAAKIICNKYERPGIPHLQRRIRAAEVALEYLNAKPLVKTEDVSSGSIVASTLGIAYSIPEYYLYILGTGIILAIGTYLVIKYYNRK